MFRDHVPLAGRIVMYIKAFKKNLWSFQKLKWTLYFLPILHVYCFRNASAGIRETYVDKFLTAIGINPVSNGML